MLSFNLDQPGLSRLLAGFIACAALLPATWAQTPANECSVAEFRALALDTHDAKAREERANRWLDGNLRVCNLGQLRALGSNRGAWLGVADTATLAGRIDGAIERRILENPDEVKALFSPAPAREASTQSTASGETPPAPRSRIVGPGTPAAVSGGAATPVPIPVPVPVPVQQAPGDQPASPERPARFSDAQRESVRSHYERSVVAGDCPPPLQVRNGRCESLNPIRLWRLGEPLPVTAVLQDVPESLGAALSPIQPGLSPARLGNDILLIDSKRRVADAIVDLGSPRPASTIGGQEPRS